MTDDARDIRRASLRNLLDRAARGALVNPDEGALLRQHVEAEIRAADQLLHRERTDTETIARVRTWAQAAIDAGDTGPGVAIGRLVITVIDELTNNAEQPGRTTVNNPAATQATGGPAWMRDGVRDLSIPAHDGEHRPADHP
jgi:hypothetical protein